MVNTNPPSTLATLQSNSSTYIDNGTSLSVEATALPNVNKGTNTVYVVAVDDANNYSPSNSISGTFTLNSTDPDNVSNLVGSDSSIKADSKWYVTLTWTAPTYQGAGNLTYLIYRSTDGVTFAQVGSSSGLSYVDNAPHQLNIITRFIPKTEPMLPQAVLMQSQLPQLVDTPQHLHSALAQKPLRLPLKRLKLNGQHLEAVTVKLRMVPVKTRTIQRSRATVAK